MKNKGKEESYTKRTLMLETGGTTVCKRTEGGLEPVITLDEILSYMLDSRSYYQIGTIQILNIDSTNTQSFHRFTTAAAIEEHYEQYDGFVIIYGTDTMACTAAALSYLIQHSQKPIVITGTQKPAGTENTDARTNLANSLFFVPCDKVHDANIVSDGKTIAGTRGKRERAKSYNAFSSINFPNVTVIQEDHIIFYLDDRERNREIVKFFHELDSNVGLLKLIPFMDASLLDYMAEHYDAVIVESFEVGGLPSYEQNDYYRAISWWIGLGKTVVMTTQVTNEGNSMSVYEVGRNIKQEFGLLEAYDMTLEVVVTKIMWIPGRTKDPEEIHRLFYETTNCDVLWYQDSIHRAR